VSQVRASWQMAQHSGVTGGLSGVGGASGVVVGAAGDGDTEVGGVSWVVGVVGDDGVAVDAGLATSQRIGGDVRLFSSGGGSPTDALEGVGSIMCIFGAGRGCVLCSVLKWGRCR
jgi:hypothetical protein